MTRLYNTQTREKETFEPQGDEVKMYVCGPTVYNYIHIGNARTFVIFDAVRRYFEWLGWPVRYVQNITDIDDRIIKQSIEEERPFAEVAAVYADEYREDMKALGVHSPTVEPKPSDHIPEIIGSVRSLIDKGHAYEAGGDVYFSVSSSSDYGKLSGHSIEDLQAGARIKPGEHKRDPMDFALWKASKEGEPWWDSPWGHGRPGWHIECSVMSIKYLGPTLDIHAGGNDLVFPHHENEIQQAEKTTGDPFSRYWLHNGFLTMDREKMSKSLGNVTTVKDLLGQYHPTVLRFYLLNTHYRKPLGFSTEALDEAKEAYLRIFNAYHQAVRAVKLMDDGRWPLQGDAALTDAIGTMKAVFTKAMDDDFNTREAVAAVFEFTRELNANMESLSRDGLAAAVEAYEDVDAVLGIIAEIPYDIGSIAMKAAAREEARTHKDWAKADAIRDEMADKGVSLQDAQGYTRIEYTDLPAVASR
jgi:cysteinyl-tRNA synthetase